jgi:hypothetical protein
MKKLNFSLLICLLALGIWSKSAFSNTKYTCSSCSGASSLKTKFCGLYDSKASKWVNGRYIDCPRDTSKDDIKYACGGCSFFPEPPGGIQVCGLFNFTINEWAKRLETKGCTPSSLPSDPSDRPSHNLPPIVSPPIINPPQDFCYNHPSHPSCNGDVNYCRDNPSASICGN